MEEVQSHTIIPGQEVLLSILWDDNIKFNKNILTLINVKEYKEYDLSSCYIMLRNIYENKLRKKLWIINFIIINVSILSEIK